jgi:hypothetical protein
MTDILDIARARLASLQFASIREEVESIADEIAAARRRGASYPAITAALHEAGISLSVNTLRVYMSRFLRQKSDAQIDEMTTNGGPK